MQTLKEAATAHLPAQDRGPSMLVGNFPGLLPENTPPVGGRVTLRHRNALVVLEGAPRISWHRSSSSEWVPVGVWPGPGGASCLREHLHGGAPLLVVVSEPVATVPLLVEELERADPALKRFAGPAEGHLVELRLPALDWLPEGARVRGLEFLRWTDGILSTTPYALCPPVLLEAPGSATNIRFARPRRGEGVTDDDCRALVEHVFASRLGDVAGV